MDGFTSQALTFLGVPDRKPKKQDAEDQMAALDRLGPLARAAIHNAPHDISADLVVRKYDKPPRWVGRANPVLIKTDFNDPALDKTIANYIDGRVKDKFGKSIADLTIEPRRKRGTR